jgi:pteridine reductase
VLVTGSKVAVITGSGKQRVGNAVAHALAAEGFDIAVHYHHSADEAEATVSELRQRGAKAMAIRANVASESDVVGLVEQVLQHFGRVDVLVNAAGIWNATPLEQVTAEHVRRHFEVNTLGTFLCSQHVGLQMVTQPEGGVIITIGDWAIQRPYRDYAAYFPSKGAIPALTRSLAVELGCRNPKVRVNCILPGPVMLPADMSQGERASVIDSTLLKREGRPENVAQAVLFLVANDYVTGICLPVDGGRTIYAGDE